MRGAVRRGRRRGRARRRCWTSLARTNLFLLPLDDRRRWFRFHHLFAQLLRVELERREPGAAAGAAPPRRRVARRGRGRPRRRSTTRSRRARSAWRGRPDRRGLGALRQRRPHVVGVRVAARVPGGGDGRHPRLLLVRPGSRRCSGSEAGMRAALARLGPLPGGALAGRLRLRRVQPRRCCGRRSPGATWRASLEEGARSAELEGPGSPWRPVVTWALGWGHYCSGDLELARRWLEETRRIGPAADQWVVDLRGGRRPVAAGRACAATATSSWRSRSRRVEMAREHGLLEAREVGEVHTAHGVALAAHGRREEALAELEQGVFLRRLWGQPLDLADGLIALALRGRRRARGDVFAEAERAARGLPGPGRAARAARGGARAPAGERRPERARADRAAAARPATCPSARSARSCSSPSTPCTRT